MSNFIFVSCQPGAENLVKRDLALRAPELRLAFSRPGFLTLKSGDVCAPDVARPTVFARSWGVSLGRAASVGEAYAALCEHLGCTPDVMHVFERDDRPIEERSDAWDAEANLLAELDLPSRAPSNGELVGDIVHVDPGHFWFGAHRHSAAHRPTAGGRPPRFDPPEGAPSRVWGKVEEALWLTGTAVDKSSHILDIGCAPGGGTQVLLERGATVVGVDPAEMAEHISNHPRFTHLPVAFETLSAEQLPQELDGFVFDVNLSPRMTLGALSTLLTNVRSLRWGFVTLKLNKLEHVDLVDWMLGKLKSAGFTELRVEQLFHNRQELFVHARRTTSNRR